MSGIMVAVLARNLLQAEAKRKQKEIELKEAKEEERILREEHLPAVMQEYGLTEMTLESGEKIKVCQELYASLTGDRKDEAFGWLCETGNAGLIKTTVVSSFSKGEKDKAEETITLLRSKGYDAHLKQEVHPMTLKAFLKSEIEKGTHVPLDLFNAHVVFAAKISRKS